MLEYARSFQLRPLLVKLLPRILLHALLPYMIYTLLSPYTSPLNAVIVSLLPGILIKIAWLIRTHQWVPKWQAIGVFVFGWIIVGIVVIFQRGDPRVLLVRESLITVPLGLVNFVLLPLSPMMYYLCLHVGPREMNFPDLWQHVTVRRYMYIVTIVWGIYYVGEFLLKVYIVYTFPLSVTVGLAPLLSFCLLALMFVWTGKYSNVVFERIRRPGAVAPA